MRRVWDSIALIVITIFALIMLFNMIEPYIPLIVISAVVVVGGTYAINHLRNW